MRIDDISDEMWKLLFGVQRSARYHDRRCRFYDQAHTLTAGLSLLLGSASVASLAQGSDELRLAAMIGSGLVAVLSSFDLVIGYARKAREHAGLKRRFIALEAAMTKAPDDELLATYKAQRLKIEADEPPKMHALDILCHVELARSYGLDDEARSQRPVFFKRWTANLFAWA